MCSTPAAVARGNKCGPSLPVTMTARAPLSASAIAACIVSSCPENKRLPKCHSRTCHRQQAGNVQVASPSPFLLT